MLKIEFRLRLFRQIVVVVVWCSKSPFVLLRSYSFALFISSHKWMFTNKLRDMCVCVWTIPFVLFLLRFSVFISISHSPGAVIWFNFNSIERINKITIWQYQALSWPRVRARAIAKLERDWVMQRRIVVECELLLNTSQKLIMPAFISISIDSPWTRSGKSENKAQFIFQASNIWAQIGYNLEPTTS